MVEVTKIFADGKKKSTKRMLLSTILQYGGIKKMVDTTASRAMPTPYYKIN